MAFRNPEVNNMLPHVVYAGDWMGLCIDFFTSGWHHFLNFTAWYVFHLENLTVKESMMAYGYELTNRKNTRGRESMLAFEKDMNEYGITPRNFLWGLRHIVRCYDKGLTALQISPALSAVLHITEKEAVVVHHDYSLFY